MWAEPILVGSSFSPKSIRLRSAQKETRLRLAQKNWANISPKHGVGRCQPNISFFLIGLGRTRSSHFSLGRNWSGLVNGGETLHCSSKQWSNRRRKRMRMGGEGGNWPSGRAHDGVDSGAGCSSSKRGDCALGSCFTSRWFFVFFYMCFLFLFLLFSAVFSLFFLFICPHPFLHLCFSPLFIPYFLPFLSFFIPFHPLIFLLFFHVSFSSPFSPLGEGVFIRGKGGESHPNPVQSRRTSKVAGWPLGSRPQGLSPLPLSSWW